MLRKIFAIDLRSLALFRVCLATVLLVDLFSRWTHIRMHYTDNGLVPGEGLIAKYGSSLNWTSLHFHAASSEWMQSLMFAIAVLSLIALLVGYRTWIANLVTWLLFISLNRRLSSLCYGFDDVMRLMLIWSLFLPLGARWSVDSTRHNQRPENDQYFSAGTVGILLQVCSIYWFTAIFKIHPDWLSGNALQIALLDRVDYHIPPIGLWLGQQRTLTVALTYATLVGEALFPCLALSPVYNCWGRWLAILAMWTFHLGIAVFMSIGLFPFACMVIWMLFIPTATWDAVFRRIEIPTRKTSPTKIEPNKFASTLAIIMIIVITAYNVLGLDHLNKRGIGIPKPMNALVKLARLDQRWFMFAPNPPKNTINIERSWYVMPAILSDGSCVDLLRDRPVAYEAWPATDPQLFDDIRSRKFFTSLKNDRKSPLWPWTARYVVRQWNDSHSADLAVTRAQIIVVGEIAEQDNFLEGVLEYDATADKLVPLSPAPFGKS